MPKLDKAATLGEIQNLYDANKAVYRLLRYGVKVKEGAGEQTKTIWLIDWENPENNHFAIAEEVTVKGKNNKRPDIVLYINGIALGIVELKRSIETLPDGLKKNEAAVAETIENNMRKIILDETPDVRLHPSRFALDLILIP